MRLFDRVLKDETQAFENPNQAMQFIQAMSELSDTGATEMLWRVASPVGHRRLSAALSAGTDAAFFRDTTVMLLQTLESESLQAPM